MINNLISNKSNNNQNNLVNQNSNNQNYRNNNQNNQNNRNNINNKNKNKNNKNIGDWNNNFKVESNGMNDRYGRKNARISQKYIKGVGNVFAPKIIITDDAVEYKNNNI